MDVFRCVSREKCGFGVAVLCKKSLLTKVNPSKRFRSFEYIDTVIKSSSKTPAPPANCFLKSLDQSLSIWLLKRDKLW